MDTSVVIFKVIVLFITMLAGIYARKRNILTRENVAALSALLVGVTNPLLMICSFQIEYHPDHLKTGLAVFALAAVIHGIMIGLSALLFRPIKDKSQQTLYRFAFIFGNVGFMGFPVLDAVYGDIGLFYGAFFNAVFNLLIWTYGFVLMRGNGNGLDIKKVLNPGLIGTLLGLVLFCLRIKLPAMVFQPLDLVGDMTFPLSMIIIGSLICDLDLKASLINPKLYYFSAMRLIVLPLLVLLICKVTHLPEPYAGLMILLQSLPSATLTAIMAETYGGDAELGAQCVGLSTLLSIGTIPLMLWLMGCVL